MPLDDVMRRFAQTRPSTFDPEARTVEAVIATTAPVMRRDARGPYAEVLDFAALDLRQAIGLPVLDNHRTASVRDTIGRVEAIRVEGDTLVAVLRLSAADDVAPVLQRIADGTLNSASIAYHITRWQQERMEGGQRRRSPAAWFLTEVTLTTNPADRAAKLRHERSSDVPDDVIETEDKSRQVERAEERTRRKDIRALVRSAGLGAEVADELIDAGADLTRAKAEIFDAVQEKRRSAPIIRSHAPANDDPEVITRRASGALAYRMAGGELADDARPYLNMTLRDMAAESLTRSGISTRGMAADEVFTRADDPHATGRAPPALSAHGGDHAPGAGAPRAARL